MKFLKTIIVEEVEKLNKKGEYIKIVTQENRFAGIPYRRVINKTHNKITQTVLDELESDSEGRKSKGIGF
jgi:soluble P-type ATPase